MKNNTNKILISPYGTEDAPFLAAIFFHTIHNINIKDYSSEQVNAWAPARSLEPQHWIRKWQKAPPLVARLKDVIVGFAEFEENGHIDCFYCHHEYLGCGVGNALMGAIQSQARLKNINKIFAEVSITAVPFFQSKGFIVVKEQFVNIRDSTMKNFIMEKNLIPSSKK